MPPRAPLPDGAGETLAGRMRQAKTKAEFQRAQCVWLRVALDLSDDDIATAVGWSANTVRCLQSRFRRRGEAALIGVGRGGRRHQNLTVAQEDELLRPFLEQAASGGILEVGRIKAAYERAVGRAVPKSTIYRLLARHGWRKLAPRPRHPKAKSTLQEEFKKNSPGSSKKK
jgi:transposase